MAKQPMQDMIVVIPGITGSVLTMDGKELWGLSAGTVVESLLHLGANLKRLRLPASVGDGDPADGVVATQLMPTAHIIPGFWAIDGYTGLRAFLSSRFELTTDTPDACGNYLEFPYDWRLSNRLTAQRLAERATKALERRRKVTGLADTKLVLICHSMGGLIARWFLDVLGGASLTRRLVTLGTPFGGSMNAALALSNGVGRRLGPLEISLSEIVRSLPSVYQLLPTYSCLETEGGKLAPITADAVSNLEASAVKDAAMFHADSVKAARSGPRPYAVHAIKGIAQPTFQSIRRERGGLAGVRDVDGSMGAGDGTVPRDSAHPQDWPSDGSALFVSQQHGSLQLDEDVQRQIFAVLTERTTRTAGGREEVGLLLEDTVLLGEPLEVTVVSPTGNERLGLTCEAQSEAGPAIRVLMNNSGNGTYTAAFSALSPGVWRVTVAGAASTLPVKAVTGLTLVWTVGT